MHTVGPDLDVAKWNREARENTERDPSLGNLKKEEEARFSPEVSYIALKYLPLFLNCQTIWRQPSLWLELCWFFFGNSAWHFFFNPRQERRRKNIWGNDVVGDRS